MKRAEAPAKARVIEMKLMQLLASDPGGRGRVAMTILRSVFGLLRRFQK